MVVAATVETRTEESALSADLLQEDGLLAETTSLKSGTAEDKVEPDTAAGVGRASASTLNVEIPLSVFKSVAVTLASLDAPCVALLGEHLSVLNSTSEEEEVGTIETVVVVADPAPEDVMSIASTAPSHFIREGSVTVSPN